MDDELEDEHNFLPGDAIDLRAAAAVLNDSHPKIAGLIRQTCDAHSIRTDLATAFDMALAIPTVLRKAKRHPISPNWASTAALALLNSAVILYVRATKTTSKHRRAFDFRSRFSKTEMEVHSKLCSLRDDAIAHYGPGPLEDGVAWQVEAVFIPLDQPDNIKIMTASKRLIEQPTLQAELTLQIESALLLADAEAERRNSQLVDLLNASIHDQALHAVITAQRINLRSFFEGEQATRRALRGPRTGYLSGHTGGD